MFQIAIFIVGISAALVVIGALAGVVIGVLYPLGKMLLYLVVNSILGVYWAIDKILERIEGH